ncbi:MAG TPA: siderophore-interacting protein [Cellvibrio sp.]|nr:siderophore-interacting protein [Cellvibrio sp.]
MSEKPARTPPRLLQVVRSQRVVPHLQRITLGGESLRGFPANSHGSHIKIFIPRVHQKIPQLPQLTEQGIQWPPAHERPVTRTYSVRAYREINDDRGTTHYELDVEFVMHGEGDDSGPAAHWAEHAQVGDFLGVAGPGGPDPLLAPADWHLLAGDMTALPAIAALLENLPAHARGCVFIETDLAANEFELIHPTGITVQWLERDPQRELLVDAIKKVAPPMDASSLSAFIAGENFAVVSIRDYLRTTYGLTKKNLYAIPYWRRGQDEETYHQERHQIMDEVY